MKNDDRLKSHVFFIVLILSIFFGERIIYGQSPKKWVAPESANELINPFKEDPGAPAEGKKIFVAMCVVCHGETGKGNGVASVAIMPHPANFLSLEIENESDGSIFWKITNGNPPMASYKTMLTDDQRWKIVTYIRKLEEKDPSYGKKH
jgi:mono/diheme cytochrome c family protein